MIEDLRVVVTDVLSTVCANVFYQQAPDHAVIPYIVYGFPSEGRSYKEKVALYLQVDLFDAERDDDSYFVGVEIDRLADRVDELFDYGSFHQGETSFWMKRTGRVSVPFPDGVHIWSRQLTYEVRTYRRLV
jgi:hypothetical protein